MTTTAANANIATLKSIPFGIEIETIGRTRSAVAAAIQTVVGGTVEHVGYPSCYDPYKVHAADGRIWTVMADASLRSVDRSLQAEVVSPILRYGDMETLQQVVRAVRKCGARVDHNCGIHIHLSADRFDTKALCNLVKYVNKQEELIQHALGISETRKASWCKPVSAAFLAKIEAKRPANLDELNTAWYGFHNPSPTHYDSTRYHGLNLHNVWFRSTVEFRYFESSLHAGKVKSYVQFILALGAKAITTRCSQSERRALNPATAKYDFRVVLLRLGLIGEEFKTARLHLTATLAGSSSRKHGELMAA